MSRGNIIFKLSGGLPCYKACVLISKLVQEGYCIKPVCTENTFEFVGRPMLESLTKNSVYYDIFEKRDTFEGQPLNDWADMTVLCPATADIINKYAAGFGGDAPTLLFLSNSLKKPYLIVPAMTEPMYTHPATQNSVKLLKNWGIKFMQAEPEWKMPEPEEIYKTIIGLMDK